MRRALVLLAGLSLGGCVYYNGVYNAQRLTKEAERADRDGRRLEAQGLYGRVAAKAESVIVRYPRSDWVDDARFLRGNAFARMRNCAGARADLEVVAYGSPDPKLARRALDALADCYSDLGEWDHAALALARLREEPDPAVRRRAAERLVAALRANGRYPEAMAVMEADSGPPYPAVDRAVVYAGVGRSDAALALVDTLLGSPDGLAAPWDSLVAVLGRADPEAASSLTSHLAVHDSLRADRRVALLLADADRWRLSDTARARRRWAQAAILAPVGPLRGAARMGLADQGLAAAADLEALRPFLDSLEAVEQMGGAAAIDAARRRRVLSATLAVVDSAQPDTVGSPFGDLLLFRAAENLRDTVGARRAAAATFDLVVQRHAASPYAPKAILALSALEPARAESLLADLGARYPGSPYLLALQGVPVAEYSALEDSLRQWAVRQDASGRVPSPRRPVARDSLR